MNVTYNIPVYDGALKVLTLEEAKRQLRIEHDYEDQEIEAFINEAVAEAESYIGALLLPRAVTFGVSAWKKDNTFPIGPVTAVTGVSYSDDTDESFELQVSEYKLYNFGGNKDVLLIKDSARENTLISDTPDAVKITATVGYAEGTIPKDVIRAVKLILTDAYEFRGDRETKINRSSRNLLRPYKRWA